MYEACPGRVEKHVGMGRACVSESALANTGAISTFQSQRAVLQRSQKTPDTALPAGLGKLHASHRNREDKMNRSHPTPSFAASNGARLRPQHAHDVNRVEEQDAARLPALKSMRRDEIRRAEADDEIRALIGPPRSRR